MSGICIADNNIPESWIWKYKFLGEENMLTIAGFIMVALMIVFLIKFKLLPITAFTVLPIVTALAIGTGFSDTMRFVATGMVRVLPIAALFIGSITYFGLMDDVGLFDAPVNWLIGKVKNNIISVFIISACIALISHLDGSGVTTLLITIPAMLPIIQALKIRVLPLCLIISAVIGVMNFLPWAGPLARAGVVTGIDPTILWKQVLPVQIFGVGLLFILCFLLAKEETKRGFFQPDSGFALESRKISPEKLALKRPKLIWFNAILTVGVIVLLFLGVPSFIPFIVGSGIALFVNYGKEGERGQTSRIKAHAADILPMIFTILCAGIFLGVLSGTKMIDAMSESIVAIVPTFFGRFLHIIMGILAIPISLVFEADTLNYGVLQVLTQVGVQYGIEPVKAALALTIGHNFGISLCMTSASVYFGLGLYGLQYGETFKYGFWRLFVMGAVMIVFAALVGVI
jgi:CitMHS family citrate-Mg2+:H+ or citrate-Ca2+:H+ symporter